MYYLAMDYNRLKLRLKLDSLIIICDKSVARKLIMYGELGGKKLVWSLLSASYLFLSLSVLIAAYQFGFRSVIVCPLLILFFFLNQASSSMYGRFFETIILIIFSLGIVLLADKWATRFIFISYMLSLSITYIMYSFCTMLVVNEAISTEEKFEKFKRHLNFIDR